MSGHTPTTEEQLEWLGVPGGFSDDLIIEAIRARVALHDELVAALEGVVSVADRKTVEFDAARAALAKAKGEKYND